jgi:hypothetical protein
LVLDAIGMGDICWLPRCTWTVATGRRIDAHGGRLAFGQLGELHRGREHARERLHRLRRDAEVREPCGQFVKAGPRLQTLPGLLGVLLHLLLLSALAFGAHLLFRALGLDVFDQLVKLRPAAFGHRRSGLLRRGGVLLLILLLSGHRLSFLSTGAAGIRRGRFRLLLR